MQNIGVVEILVVVLVAVVSVFLGRWLGKRNQFSLSNTERAVFPQKVRFFTSAKDRDTTIFMVLCFGTVWMLARWFREHIDVATVSLVLGSLITVIITMGAALYPEGNTDSDGDG